MHKPPVIVHCLQNSIVHIKCRAMSSSPKVPLVPWHRQGVFMDHILEHSPWQKLSNWWESECLCAHRDSGFLLYCWQSLPWALWQNHPDAPQDCQHVFMYLFIYLANIYFVCTLDVLQDFEDTMESRAVTWEAVLAVFFNVLILWSFISFFYFGLEDRGYINYKGERF